MVVFDTTQDPRFAANPMVTTAPFIRFYAGIALVDRSGFAVGALCVVDMKPRDTAPDLFRLAALARQAERIITA